MPFKSVKIYATFTKKPEGKTAADTDKTETKTEKTKPAEPTSDPAKLPDATVYGDLNADTKVDIMDVITYNKFLLGIKELDDQAKANADTDKSGQLDSEDALNILKKALEMIELPVTK